jgi:hypothetical protein
VTKSFRMCLIAAALAASTACGGSSSPTASTTVTQSSFTLSVVPSPITATRCSPQCSSDSGNTTFAFSATITITMQESAGIGANINMITLTGSSGSVTFTPLVFSAADVIQHGGSNHVNGRGSLSVPLTIVYNTPSGSANLAVGINVQLTDDRNNQVTATGQVNVI